ncbi:MAG: hypothetical protein Q4C88_04560 [Akkermansia sp.]|nr:hypothetical protein [Akkermansia sp.]
MTPHRSIRRRLIVPNHLHVACGAAALLCCIPLLFPQILPERAAAFAAPYLGAGILACMLFSLAVMLIAVGIRLSRLRNLGALGQLSLWAVLWCCTFGGFVLLALAADVPPPAVPQKEQPIQDTDTLHSANEILHGPAGLLYRISTDDMPEDRLVDAPNLSALEKGHEDILKRYIDLSPRWRPAENDDTFHSKPGHLVLMPPTSTGTPGLVHAAFRRLVGGEKLPEGYVVLKPGDAVPAGLTDGHKQIPDLALDLGRDHYLLMAWRGAPHMATAVKSVNAAIRAVDERMRPLAENPTYETVLRMLDINKTLPGNSAEMLLCSPPAQEGCYQAEFYANPHEAGTLQIFFRRLEDSSTLRTFTIPARYSDKPNELFRHDLPGSMGEWERAHNKLNNIFDKDIPLFVLLEGKGGQYIDVAVELWFQPDAAARPRRLLLRRCYSIQPYSANRKADIDVPAPEEQEKPAVTPQPDSSLRDNIRKLLPGIMS